MEFLRTPDNWFNQLTGYPFRPRYTEVGDDGLRMHYVTAGPKDAPPVLLLHGEPSWSYLYRHMIPIFAEAGWRPVAPDLIGFGRSDKPVRREDYTQERHVEWMIRFVEALDLKKITLVCQDWGGIIGLRLVAAQPTRFDRVVVANTFLPTGEHPMPDAFMAWRKMSQDVPVFGASAIIQTGTTSPLSPEVLRAYDAPFPDESYKAGARAFPMLVPVSEDSPGAAENREAWKVLEGLDLPFATAFSDKDPIMSGLDAVFQERLPGASDQPHVTIEGAGHFLQEDRGPELAHAVLSFMEPDE